MFKALFSFKSLKRIAWHPNFYAQHYIHTGSRLEQIADCCKYCFKTKDQNFRATKSRFLIEDIFFCLMPSMSLGL